MSRPTLPQLLDVIRDAQDYDARKRAVHAEWRIKVADAGALGVVARLPRRTRQRWAAEVLAEASS